MIFRAHDDAGVKAFVQDGFCIYRGVFPIGEVQKLREFVFDHFDLKRDPHEQGTRIMDMLAKHPAFAGLVEGPAAVNTMRKFLGPDIAIFNYDALWINVPRDKNPVLLKGQHTDAWTGTSVHTVFAKLFLTDVDAHNGIAVSPGSHLQGMLPVRNRGIDPLAKVKFKDVNLTDVRAGDWLLWHPLLVHKTVGHSAKNIRISITSRYTSTETPFSSQERALGYRTISVGPMNQILRLVGNDYLTPLRTYGGTVAIDKRLASLYR